MNMNEVDGELNNFKRLGNSACKIENILREYRVIIKRNNQQ